MAAAAVAVSQIKFIRARASGDNWKMLAIARELSSRAFHQKDPLSKQIFRSASLQIRGDLAYQEARRAQSHRRRRK